MNIAMFTNDYPPHIGGVACSVSRLAAKLQKFGHRVLVIAPRYDVLTEEPEDNVIRLQSIKNVSDTSFSLAFPFSIELGERLSQFNPDIIHSHYPFMVGDMALRYGALKQIPVVFTHHTRYEAYEAVLPWDIEGFEDFITQISTGYANLCKAVIAPTQGMAELLRKNGVVVPIHIIPTGVDMDRFAHGNGSSFRKETGIKENRFVVGYAGRLAPEKNLDFWSESVCAFLKNNPNAHALVVGDGNSASAIKKIFESYGLSRKLTMTGMLSGKSLVNAYHAMDVFAFTSVRETQGIVLVEALASGCPVIALDARGVRDVVSDGLDGHLVRTRDKISFSNALGRFAQSPGAMYNKMRTAAVKNAARFDIDHCIEKNLSLYRQLTDRHAPSVLEVTGWDAIFKLAGREIQLWKTRFGALWETVTGRKRKE